MNKIEDYNIYTSKMSKSMKDKFFFKNEMKNKVDLFVDFGCADGALIRTMANTKELNSCSFIGFDQDEKMLTNAILKTSDTLDCLFTTDWNRIKASMINKRTVLILSSIIHEIYSYYNEADIAGFWNKVFCSGFKYIIIRDMIYHIDMARISDNGDMDKVYNKGNKEQIQSFITKHGSLMDNLNLVHFLFKYTYTTNWKREVNENYFPLNICEMLSLIPHNYMINLFDPTIPKYIRDKIKEDFDISLRDTTHLKMILERK